MLSLNNFNILPAFMPIIHREVPTIF